MTTALPPESWALILLSVGLGLAVELAFLRAQRGRRSGGADGRGGPVDRTAERGPGGGSGVVGGRERG